MACVWWNREEPGIKSDMEEIGAGSSVDRLSVAYRQVGEAAGLRRNEMLIQGIEDRGGRK